MGSFFFGEYTEKGLANLQSPKKYPCVADFHSGVNALFGSLLGSQFPAGFACLTDSKPNPPLPRAIGGLIFWIEGIHHQSQGPVLDSALTVLIPTNPGQVDWDI
jgi:hypothetical protein